MQREAVVSLRPPPTLFFFFGARDDEEYAPAAADEFQNAPAAPKFGDDEWRRSTRSAARPKSSRV